MNDRIPKSTQQSINFFNDFIRKSDVQNFIIKLRKETFIPENGFSFEKEDEDIIFRESDYFLFYLPRKFFKDYSVNYDAKAAARNRLLVESLRFLNKKGIDSPFINSLFRLYIVFNKTITHYPNDLAKDDLLILEDLNHFLSWYDENQNNIISYSKSKSGNSRLERLNSLYGHLKNKSIKYPFVLYINPNASQKQIIDFISRHWNKIKKHDNDPKIDLTKNRTKRKQERNDFIYENRNLPLKKIAPLVSKQFPGEYLDEGNIGKIISLENKKRN